MSYSIRNIRPVILLNDGSVTNREAFAKAFTEAAGMDYYENEERFLEYYRVGFQECAKVCGITDVSRKIVETLQKKGYTVAIATNPIFPEIATYSRLRWLGIEVKLVTDCLLNTKKLPMDSFEQGSLEDVLVWAENLPEMEGQQ